MLALALAPEGAIAQPASPKIQTQPTIPPPVLQVPPPIRVETIGSILTGGKPASFPAAPEPLSDPHSWVTPTDYPPQALSEGHEGRAGFEVAVLPNGRVGDCVVTASSGWGELDQATCRLLLQRARFRPAYDAAGKVVLGTYREAIAWRLPEGPRVDSFSARFVFVVETDGTIHDCRVMAMTGEVPRALLIGNPCTDRRHHTPYRDAAGRTIRQQVTLAYGAQVRDVPVQRTTGKRRRR